MFFVSVFTTQPRQRLGLAAGLERDLVGLFYLRSFAKINEKRGSGIPARTRANNDLRESGKMFMLYP